MTKRLLHCVLVFIVIQHLPKESGQGPLEWSEQAITSLTLIGTFYRVNIKERFRHTLVAERHKQEPNNAQRNTHVSHIKSRPMITMPMEIKEIYHNRVAPVQPIFMDYRKSMKSKGGVGIWRPPRRSPQRKAPPTPITEGGLLRI